MVLNRLSVSAKIPLSVWGLGMATFLMNVSTVIVFSLAAVYMKMSFGASLLVIGLIEAVVESSAYLVKLFSGFLSDRIRKRKLLVSIGFWCSALSRPIIAIFYNIWGAFTYRLLGRIGNGLQATPRDALVGDLAPTEIRGTCFGIRQAFSLWGSAIGGLVATICMEFFDSDFRAVFWIASVIGFMSIVPLTFFVKEPKPIEESIKPEHKCKKISIKDIKHLGKSYWALLIIAFIFMCARVSESMLMLHAKISSDMPAKYIPLIVVIYNLSSAFISYPIGVVSDKLPRYFLLGIGFLFLIISSVVLAIAQSHFGLVVGVILWGAQIGITQGMFITIISDLVPQRLFGTAFGFFHFVSAIATFIATAVGGYVAGAYGMHNMYLGVSFAGVISLIILTALVKKGAIR